MPAVALASTNAQAAVSVERAQQTRFPSVTHRTAIMRHPTTLTPSPGSSTIKLLFLAAPLVAALVSVLIIVTVFSTDVPYLTNGFQNGPK
ncbi:hypothetical protein [Burkholderia sp. Bp9143]|uniref:hypothetical protein n=1 Tax=Burkholderia sp. Bp9143 TaxID=2184574 RepID=UPI000F597E9E|nr:hypothetical protein [Burkholderia sp. Bp9143]